MKLDLFRQYGRRPRLSFGIVIAVMFAIFFASTLAHEPNILWLWLPIGAVLGYILESVGWWTRGPAQRDN